MLIPSKPRRNICLTYFSTDEEAFVKQLPGTTTECLQLSSKSH